LTLQETKRIKKLIEADNAYAFYNLAVDYARGDLGMPQDMAKANELYLRAGQLGCAEAYYNLGCSYYNGEGVEVDKKKTENY
jgi:TPR repeat protein